MLKDDLAELKRAVRRLEQGNLAGAGPKTSGRDLDRALARLPKPLKRRIDRAIERAALRCLAFVARAPRADTARRPLRPAMGLLLAGLSGGIGGALGGPGVLIELPVITLLILRQIADIARQSGEDLTTTEARIACLEVFALGARGGAADANPGYFATRTRLARLAQNATHSVVERGVSSAVFPPLLVRVAAELIGRFGASLSERALAGAIPVIGAVTGGAMNALFMRQFQNLAQAHFIVRRLERRYGAETVRIRYAEIRADLRPLRAAPSRRKKIKTSPHPKKPAVRPVTER
ncbi:EcsC family protein [Methylocystis heyeri]|uniref:EcsC family protein n=1 Tax=Methylocystis heyeri TaxID=391905 RepID=A0A6B8K9C0_9HYPH|nr:EcsC family protein [Methylocystis heyeri]QGM44307.1 hypothetical protein H2LOC_000525 [Methylocystis heyeri]